MTRVYEIAEEEPCAEHDGICAQQGAESHFEAAKKYVEKLLGEGELDNEGAVTVWVREENETNEAPWVCVRVDYWMRWHFSAGQVVDGLVDQCVAALPNFAWRQVGKEAIAGLGDGFSVRVHEISGAAGPLGFCAIICGEDVVWDASGEGAFEAIKNCLAKARATARVLGLMAPERQKVKQ